MRFQTILSLVVIGLATSVSAQSNSTVTPQCTTCLLSAVKIFPACTANTWNAIISVDPTQMTGDQKNCFCSMVSMNSWANGCITPTTCSQDMINDMNQEFAPENSIYCAGFTATIGNSGAMSSKNVMAFTIPALAAAMATAMVFL